MSGAQKVVPEGAYSLDEDEAQSWYQDRAAKLCLRMRLLITWGFVQASIFGLVHLPFRLAFEGAELDPVWIVAGILLDLPRVSHLMHLFYGRCSWDSFWPSEIYQKLKSVMQLLPWNLGIWLLLLAGVIPSPADAWPYRMAQFVTWLPLREVFYSLAAWDQELNTTRKHRFRLTICLGTIFLVYHWFACVWWLIGRWRGFQTASDGCTGNRVALLPECTWGPNEALWEANLTNQYFFSFYWAVLVLTTAEPTTQASVSGQACVLKTPPHALYPSSCSSPCSHSTHSCYIHTSLLSVNYTRYKRI
jgi:hypothetical protein